MAHTWTVEDHLDGKPAEHVALYRRVEELILGLGPVTTSVSKTTITFRGEVRGFAGARPDRTGVRGYLDLQRVLDPDPRILSHTPYTGRLVVHQYRLRTADELDETFAGWLAEAFRVGQGDHRR